MEFKSWAHKHNDTCPLHLLFQQSGVHCWTGSPFALLNPSVSAAVMPYSGLLTSFFPHQPVSAPRTAGTSLLSCPRCPARVLANSTNTWLMNATGSPWKLASRELTKKGSWDCRNRSSPLHFLTAGFRASVNQKLRTGVCVHGEPCISLGRGSIVHTIFSEDLKTPERTPNTDSLSLCLIPV